MVVLDSDMYTYDGSQPTGTHGAIHFQSGQSPASRQSTDGFLLSSFNAKTEARGYAIVFPKDYQQLNPGVSGFCDGSWMFVYYCG